MVILVMIFMILLNRGPVLRILFNFSYTHLDPKELLGPLGLLDELCDDRDGAECAALAGGAALVGDDGRAARGVPTAGPAHALVPHHALATLDLLEVEGSIELIQ